MGPSKYNCQNISNYDMSKHLSDFLTVSYPNVSVDGKIIKTVFDFSIGKKETFSMERLFTAVSYFSNYNSKNSSSPNLDRKGNKALSVLIVCMDFLFYRPFFTNQRLLCAFFILYT